LQNKIEQFDYTEKQALIFLHWNLDDYEEADYYRLNEVLSAKEEKDRPIDPLSLLK
jgi:hypothetical protein